LGDAPRAQANRAPNRVFQSGNGDLGHRRRYRQQRSSGIYKGGSRQGAVVRAAEVERAWYPHLVEKKGWDPRPWDGSRGIGMHLVKLPGVKRFLYDWPEGSRKTYQLPLAETAANVVELPTRKRA
jgi:hypothetical protein